MLEEYWYSVSAHHVRRHSMLFQSVTLEGKVKSHTLYRGARHDNCSNMALMAHVFRHSLLLVCSHEKWQKLSRRDWKKRGWEMSSTYFLTSAHLVNHSVKWLWVLGCRFRKVAFFLTQSLRWWCWEGVAVWDFPSHTSQEHPSLALPVSGFKISLVWLQSSAILDCWSTVLRETGVYGVNMVWCMSLCRPSAFSPRLKQCLAIGSIVVTLQKLVTDVCFLVCTVPPFLPLTVAPGLTLSENFHSWQPRLLPQPPPQACSLLSCAGTQTPFPLKSNNASIGFCTEWRQPRGLACNRPLLQTEAHMHTHWIHSQHCSTRWMANRDAPRSKSPPAAGW